MDITFDYRKIKQNGSWDDPDLVSEELKQAHKVLWSKQLPNGEISNLKEGLVIGYKNEREYLVLETSHVKYKLTSDSMINSYLGGNVNRLGETINLISDEEKIEFLRLGYTIGNFILFPGNQVSMMETINVKRQLVYQDRFDFTLDAIRKYYLGENSALYECLSKYLVDRISIIASYMYTMYLVFITDNSTNTHYIQAHFDSSILSRSSAASFPVIESIRFANPGSIFSPRTFSISLLEGDLSSE